MSDAALWTAQRALQEKEAVLRRLAPAQETVISAVARDALREANAIAHFVAVKLFRTHQ